MELSTLVEAAVPATHHRNQDSDGARAVPVHTIPHIENPGAPPSAAALGASSDTMDHAEGPIPAVGAAAQAPGGPEPKTVRFELVSAESPQYRARLPMRVQIYPHDTTESIVTTVKNFYGLYSSHNIAKGVSFEDQHTNTLIARYENFRNNMVVYVRVIEEPAPGPAPFPGHSFHPTTSGTPPFLNGDTFSLQAPQQFGQHISRPGSRTSRKRSLSPNSGRGRRSASASTNPKARSRSSKTHGPGSQGQPDCADSLNGGYSSGDGASGSVSGRSKEHLGNTEISLENIVEGGRRKRAKFESSVSRRPGADHLFSSDTQANVSPSVRNCRCLRRRRCRPRHRTPPSRPPVVPTPTGRRCSLSIPAKAPSLARGLFSRPMPIPVDLAMRESTPRPCPTAVVPVRALAIQLASASARAPSSFLLPILRSGAACRKRTRTWRCS